MKKFVSLFLALLFCGSAALAQSPTLEFSFGAPGSGNGLFNQPGGIAFASTGNAYITDRTNNRIQVFNSEGVFVTQFDNFGLPGGQLNLPTAVAISAISGNIFVTERNNHRVSVFNSAHVFQYSFGVQGTGNGEFEGPIGIALGDADNIFVVDRGNNRIQKFSEAGTYQTQFGSIGSSLGQFNTPTGLAFAPNGKLYIVDRGNHRVQYFDTTASPVFAVFGSFGTAAGFFDTPARIAVSQNNQLYVTDFENDRIQAFDLNGSPLFQFGSAGSAQGFFDNPVGIAILEDKIWISEVGNNRVQVFFDASLPVEWLSFQANMHQTNVELEWIIAQEINNSHFSVQRSENLVDWHVIAEMKTQAKGNGPTSYRYQDNINGQSAPEFYYRIQQIDVDGKYAFSPIVHVAIPQAKFWLNAFPSPTLDFINLEVKTNGRANLRLIDNQGFEYYTGEINAVDEFHTFRLDLRTFPSGIYYLELQMGTSSQVQKIVKI